MSASARLQSLLPTLIVTAKTSVLPVATLVMLVFMILPVPVLLLDIGFILNITIALAVLMIALNAAKPLDFSSFPTVLLFATLMRLALNVASTRVVLVQGHEGPHAAGKVIEAFGNFLIGGNYIVGIFVFTILMIINLVVITKGAGRVSEVTARFTLDALPGKQMAIDADLGAGLLTAEEAKKRREEVATESDFYGSMDGASKFVKGDAVAGVLILFINIIGGIILGLASHGLSLAEAAEIYILLAVGDALVAQVPALLLSIAAAAIVTRVASPLDLSGQIAGQFAEKRSWIAVAAILIAIGVMPGMPHLVILPIGIGAAAYAWHLHRREQLAPNSMAILPPEAPASQIDWNEVSDSAILGIEIGYGLVPLVDERKNAPLMSRLTGIRRQLSRELGFVVPLVRVKDNLSLDPNSYRIIINGVITGEDRVVPDRLLALDSGEGDSAVKGVPCKDPTFGLDALWIAPELRSEAVVSGFTVVDPSTVIATHFNHLVTLNAAELFGMDDARSLIDTLKEVAPQLVEALTPQPLTLGQVMGICRALLRESVPLRDFRRLADAMVAAANEKPVSVTTSIDDLVEAVRRRIGSLIIQALVPVKMPLPVISLAPELEDLVAQAIAAAGDSRHPIAADLAEKIIAAVHEATRPMVAQARRFALVTSPTARLVLMRLLKAQFPEMPVLSFYELPEDKALDVVAVVGASDIDRSAKTASNQPEMENG